MKYNYKKIQDEIEQFLFSHPDEYFYTGDIVKAVGYTAYVIDRALKNIETSQVMSYTSEKLVYVHKSDTEEKQIPQSFVNNFISNGWMLGRCDNSKRAICIAAGGDPDKIKTVKIHKEYENLEVTEEQVKHYIEQGWSLGYINTSTLGKVAIHKGNVEKYVFPEEVFKYVSEGWLQGGKEKRELRDYSNVWNKGKTKETDPRLLPLSEKARQQNLNMPQEQRDRTSASVKRLWQQKDYRENQIAHMQGREPWNKGKVGLYKWTDEQRKKHNETKRKNKTFNTSKPEEDYYKYLIELYGDNNVLRQYEDERYPFHCDFYIPSEDLFIELNAHWTHGDEPFDIQNPNHQSLLKVLESKSETSRFYKVAVDVWTRLDVLKRETAIRNKLNYEVIYGNYPNQRRYRIG